MINSRFLLLAVLLTAVQVHAQNVSSLIQKGDGFDKKLKTTSALACYCAAEKIEPKNPEVLAKIAKQYGAEMADTDSKDEKRALGKIALGYAERAEKLAPDSALTQLSLAVCYGRLAPFMDSKTKIEYSKNVKVHVLKSLALDPTNDLTYYVIGAWEFEMANLNPLLVTVAKWIYGDLPASSNPEAVKYFQKAISINPQRISSHVELGRTYAAMGDKEKARTTLKQALALPNREKDDPDAKIRAQTALDKL